jgi:hypothetical protein
MLRELARDLKRWVGLPVEYSVVEQAIIHGFFTVACYDPQGRRLSRSGGPNLVADVGARLMLDQALAGSGYTVVGPFMGLISSVSFTAVALTDTMATHPGWLEAGTTNAPTYTAPRKTTNGGWNAAIAPRLKALTTPLAYAMTGIGTVQGAFLVYGTGAVSTVMDTNGSLYSAGAFGTPQPVINGNTLSVSYSTNL